MKIMANGITVNYKVTGAGSALVLVHGAGDNLGMWYHQTSVFSASHRVIAYDVRGSGETESPEGDYSLSLFADDAYELMKALDVPHACFLGYSMGGRIALEMAIRHPEMVKGLILVSTPVLAVGSPPPGGQGGRRGLPNMDPGGDIQTFAEMMTVAGFSPGFRSANPAEFDRYMTVKLQNQPKGLGRLMRSLGGLATQPDLGGLKCPVLMVAGDNDSLISIERSIRAHEAIPGSELVVLPSGHAVPIEAPHQFNAAVLEFLSRT